jgi:hypothetical protein
VAKSVKVKAMAVVAALQMASGPNVNANLLEAERLLAKAAAAGAQLAVLPGAKPLEHMAIHYSIAISAKTGK